MLVILSFNFARILEQALKGGVSAATGMLIGGLFFASNATCQETLTTLASFNGTNGARPYSALLQGADGNFYGTTSGGGAFSRGTIFKMTPAGMIITLVSFDGDNGALPYASLIQTADGNFYGTTSTGGAFGKGTVYELSAVGLLATLVSFNGVNGYYPYAGLVLGADDELYGTTVYGGAFDDGTIFKVRRQSSVEIMASKGDLTTLLTFNGTNGYGPSGGLALGLDGDFYGATTRGVANDDGTVFRMSPDGAGRILGVFTGPNGSLPYAGLVQDSTGYFYGVTEGGGTNQSAGKPGTIFKVSPNGGITSVYSFGATLDARGYPIDGASPRVTLLQGSTGNFYGTALEGGEYGSGTLFHLVLDPVTSAFVSFTSLISFNVTNGAYPAAGLIMGTDGAFYGTTSGGGSFGYGTVFKLTMPAPVLQAKAQRSGSMNLTLTAVPGQTYQFQFKPDVRTVWRYLLSTNSPSTTVTVPVSTGFARQFYRAVLIK